MRKQSVPISLLLLSLLAACKSEINSPTAALDQVAPQVVCGAQKTTPVTLTGSGFTPLPIDTLTDQPRIELPKVHLKLRTNPDGSPGNAMEIIVPDDTAPPGNHTTWQSDKQMSFDVYPELSGLTPGLYDVAVVNPDGKAAGQPNSLGVVPAPTLTQAAPVPICDAEGNVTVKLTGAGFLNLNGMLPVVRFGDNTEVPATDATNCTPLPAPSGVMLASCASLTVQVQQGLLQPGSYAVTVKNPKDADCATMESVKLVVVPPPLVTDVMSATICTAQRDSTIVLSGTGFLVITDAQGRHLPDVQINGMSFPVTIDDLDCMPVPDAPGTETCTRLSVTVPQSALGTGTYPLTVTNPAPAACHDQMMLTLTVVPPPTLTSFRPAVMCSGGDVATVTGTGLRDNATVYITNGRTGGNVSIPSTSVSVAAGGQSATVNFAGPIPPDATYDVSWQNPDGCSALLQNAVSITRGPSILFVDPPAVPNVIAVQATVYGSGITGSVSSVEISPAGKATWSPLQFQLIPNPAGGTFPNRVQATIPAGLLAGSYDMRLSDGTTCKAFLAGAVRVVATATLTVSSVTPAFGSTAQNTAVVISGTGFVSTPRVYLNSAGATSAQNMGAVTFQGATSLTGVVRSGLPPATYDVLVVNPDGSYGLKSAGFKVTPAATPPPVITAVAPSSVVTGTSTAALIQGTGFRAGAQVGLACYDAMGNTVAGAAAGAATVNANGTISTTLTGVGLYCIVRVTDTDNMTYFDFSAIGVTNASLNLTGFTTGSTLTTARRGLAASAGRPTAVARYVYAIGGDNGADAMPLKTVEAAPTSLGGVLGQFLVQTQQLPAARSFLGVASVGRFLYAVGGFDGTAATKLVYRAELLNPLAAPPITDVDVQYDTTKGLGPGLYIYRVSAVLSTDTTQEANNPGGETLAGDFFPIQLPTVPGGKLKLLLFWTKVPTATSYRIYRSPKADDTAGKELLLATVQAGAMAPQFLDDGAGTPMGASPLPLGSTGAWRPIAQLTTARIGAGVAAAQDPATPAKWYLYAAGGNSGTLAAPTALTSVEFLPITVDPATGNQAFTTWQTATSTLGMARWQVSAIAANSAQNPKITGGTYLWVPSGSGTGLANLVDRIDVALVQAGGQLAVFSDAGSSGIKRPAFTSTLLNNQLTALGGLAGGNATQAGDSATLNTATTLNNFNALGGGKLLQPRALQGLAVESAFIYQLGGANAAVGTATNTTEQTIW